MMTNTVYRARFITALLTLILGLVTLWQSYNLPFGSLSRIRAGFFPVVFGGLLTVLSILMLVSLVLARRKGGVTSEHTDTEEPVNLRGVLSFVGIFILFLVVSHLVGFIAASFFAMAAAGYLLGMRGWRLIVLTVATTASVWLIFDKWLGISLPSGIWL